MATPVKRIEKEFLFKALFEEKLPIMYLRDRSEFVLTLEHPAHEEITLRMEKPIGKLKVRDKLDLIFDYRGQVIDFTAEIRAIRDDVLICNSPETMYKNLDRNYLRVDTPSDLKILFTFRGDRYNLSFPRVTEYETIGSDEFLKNLESRNLSDLIKQMTGWLKNYADGYKIINFKDKQPETIEERIVSETGKTLYIPSTSGYLPQNDPYPKKRIITEELFKRYLEGTGVGVNFLDDTCARFIKGKHDSGIFSDAWVPVLFHEYVIGYIHVWIDKEGKPPFDFTVIDNMYQFSKVLAFSLKENGYFERGKMPNEPFAGRVLDISASGLMFAHPHSHLSTTLLVDAELTISIITPNRTINVVAKIVRRFKDKSAGYFGCRFTTIAPEDTRYLFEYLYGRQIDDRDAGYLSGQV
ncbi:MAG: PilZ domain-containing protein [Treponema sp.]|jgi:c-di-GMP-binding flagellar brake protein YcgR|nr:PilZ domain-containing protein [Treponema sp.]